MRIEILRERRHMFLYPSAYTRMGTSVGGTGYRNRDRCGQTCRRNRLMNEICRPLYSAERRHSVHEANSVFREKHSHTIRSFQ